jgi:glycosyltransferase involved in cell wall biosynthesis
MKILIVNICAQYGSTGHIVSILKQGYEKNKHKTIVCYGSRNEKIKQKGYYKLSNIIESFLSALFYRFFGYQGFFLNRPTNRLLSIIKKESPDIVQLLNIHGYYLDEFKLLSYLANSGIPTIYSMMDEYAYMGKCVFSYDCEKFKEECKDCRLIKEYPASLFFDRSSYYFNKKGLVYDSFKNIVFTGVPWVVSRAKQSKLLRDKDIRIVNEPIDLDNYFYPQDATELRKELSIPKDNIVVLTVAVLSSPRKGGKFFLDLCRQMGNKEGYSFVYVGYDTDEYDAPDNIIKIPYVSSMKRLAELFSLADVFVSTTLSDTIPNACIDALGCGTPICGFDISGLSFIGIKDTSLVRLVRPFDIAALEDAVSSFSKKDNTLIKKCRASVYYDYSPQKVVGDYLDIFESIKDK